MMYAKIIEKKNSRGLGNKLALMLAICYRVSPYSDKPHEPVNLVDPIWLDIHGEAMPCDYGAPRSCFSQIYDMDYFNSYMKNEKIQIIRQSQIPNDCPLQEISDYYTWTRYVKLMTALRKLGHEKDFIASNDFFFLPRRPHVLLPVSLFFKMYGALKLNRNNQALMKSYSHFNHVAHMGSVQFMTGTAWKHSSKYYHRDYESSERILEMYKKQFPTEKNIFFTCGEGHEKLAETCRKFDLNPHYYHSPDLGYDLNTAINSELCARAKSFSGNSESSFTNLITTKRFIFKLNESYIYNKQGELTKRRDGGIYTRIDLNYSFPPIIGY